ncbi:MAG: DNA methyltransferase [Nanopusillaceae archaeon]
MEIVFREIVKLPSTTYATHGLYMYPAKFIPHVVRYVIEKYSKEGDWIFDPFAGYGTVAIEATLTNRNALLWDLNPITEVLTYASTYRGDISLEDFEINWEYDNPFHPRWKNILYWHPKKFYDILSKLWGYWHFEIYDKAKKKEELQKAYLVAIPLFKITRYFSYSDEKISKLYKSKYARHNRNLILFTWKND